MGSGFSKKKKQAKQMQEQILGMQSKFKDLVATGSAGGGLVEITLNGDQAVTKVKIKPECVDPQDIEGLEDLIKVAFNDASLQLNKNMPKMPAGLDLSSLGL